MEHMKSVLQQAMVTDDVVPHTASHIYNIQMY